jgi:hypothetical protein
LLIDNNILGAVHGILLENEKRKWYFSIASVSFRLQITYGSTRHTSIQIATLVNLHRVITRPVPYAGIGTGLWLVLIPLIAADLQEDHQ